MNMELYCIDNKLNTHTLDLTIGKVYKIEHIHANVAYTTNDSGKIANYSILRFADKSQYREILLDKIFE